MVVVGGGREGQAVGTRLKDVADLAGVSFKTVSNVINDYPHVRPTTKQKVLDANTALGDALRTVTASDIASWFKPRGYRHTQT